jgi:hypothetical protein
MLKILSMSAATIDRLLRMAKSAMHAKKARRVVPEPRRHIKMRTFADWNEPHPGSMEMDLVAHCGEVNRGRLRPQPCPNRIRYRIGIDGRNPTGIEA